VQRSGKDRCHLSVVVSEPTRFAGSPLHQSDGPVAEQQRHAQPSTNAFFAWDTAPA